MATLKETIRGFIDADDGATAIEYGLIASLVCLVIVGAVQNLGNVVLVGLFNKIAASF